MAGKISPYQEKRQKRLAEQNGGASDARKRRLALGHLDQQGLDNLVMGKGLSPKIYSRAGVDAEVAEFDYDGFQSDTGLKLVSNKTNSGRAHHFGFKLDPNGNGNSMIIIHYAAVREEDGVNYKNEVRKVNPKRFSANTLLKMIGQHI